MNDRVLQGISLFAAVVIVGGGLYLLLDKAAPIVGQAPQPAIQAATPPQSPPAYQPPAVEQDRPVGPAIYRCSSGGTVVYSDTPCKGGRVVDVQVTEGFEGRRYQQKATRPVVVENAPAASTAPSATQPEGSTNAAPCEAILKAIADIDAAARVGGTIPRMEYLKEERRKLVEKRQELRC